MAAELPDMASQPNPTLLYEALWPGLGLGKPPVPVASWSLVGFVLGGPEGDRKAGGEGSWDLLLPDFLLVLSTSPHGWFFILAAEVSSGFQLFLHASRSSLTVLCARSDAPPGQHPSSEAAVPAPLPAVPPPASGF